MATLLAITSAVAGRSRSLVAPETMNNTANRTRPKVTNAGMVGLIGVLKDAGSQWHVDYGRSAAGFQTMKFSSADVLGDRTEALLAKSNAAPADPMRSRRWARELLFGERAGFGSSPK